MNSVFNRLSTGLKRFISDRKGNIAITFAILVVPLFAAAGAAVDYSRVSNEHSNLQEALDSAVLAAASAGIKTDKTRLAIGEKYFHSNTRNPCDNEVNLTIENNQVVGTASCEMKTAFLGIIGFEKFTIDGRAVAGMAGLADQEIVLVLDYSSSMKDKNKYRVMRDAAIELVKSISSSPGADKVKVGLVPFSQHVYATMESDFIVNEDPGGTWTNCTKDRRYPYNTTGQTPASSDNDSKWGLDSHGSKSYAECSDYSKKALIIQPLTSNHSAIITQLKAMKPHENTHISLGLSFGRHVISPNAPFTQGASYADKKTYKTIILLTDGKQTQPAWGPFNSLSRQNGEENLVKLCDDIKEKPIKITTVAFDLDDKPTVDRLKQCASGPENFYDAANTSQLVAAFSDISISLYDQAILLK